MRERKVSQRERESVSGREKGIKKINVPIKWREVIARNPVVLQTEKEVMQAKKKKKTPQK